MEHFITPHGGALVNLMADADKAEALKTESQHFPSLTLSQRQLCDVELLMNDEDLVLLHDEDEFARLIAQFFPDIDLDTP